MCIRDRYQAAGLQFIPPDFDSNMVVAIVFVRHDRDNTNVTVADTLQSRIEALAGIELSELIGVVTSDRAAAGVGNELDVLDSNVCLMHDGDKVGKPAIGDLVRSKKGRVVNPFKEGQVLINRIHKLAVWFSYSSRLSVLHDMARVLKVRRAPSKGRARDATCAA